MSAPSSGKPARVLVACIGNVFFGDDAFGVEVCRALHGAPHALPPGARAVDFGIRGLDLAYALLDPWDAVVLVDAVQRGGAPGTLYVLEPEVDGGDAEVEPHALQPEKVLALARSLGAALPPLRVIGCEAAAGLCDDEFGAGLSTAVAAAVGPAVALVAEVIEELISPEARHA